MIENIRNALFIICIISAIWLACKTIDTFRHDRDIKPLLKQLFIFLFFSLLYAIFIQIGER